VATLVRTIVDQPDATEVEAQSNEWLTRWLGSCPRLLDTSSKPVVT